MCRSRLVSPFAGPCLGHQRRGEAGPGDDAWPGL